MNTREAARQYRLSQWTQRLREQKSSGLSITARCDATNRMVKGVTEAGEESHYIYNGLGYLVANEWIVEKNAYGYTDNSLSPSEQVGGVVVCDRHSNVSVKPSGTWT